MRHYRLDGAHGDNYYYNNNNNNVFYYGSTAIYGYGDYSW